jgi:hypothetical protein
VGDNRGVEIVAVMTSSDGSLGRKTRRRRIEGVGRWVDGGVVVWPAKARAAPLSAERRIWIVAEWVHGVEGGRGRGGEWGRWGGGGDGEEGM